MPNSGAFEDMLQAYRALGGIADNIAQGSGPYGAGLFPAVPGQPCLLHTPERLLIDVDHVVLAGDELVIDPAHEVDPAVRAFFNDYQKRFSWGAEGRSRVDAFESGLRSFPEALLQKLTELRFINLRESQAGDWPAVLRRSFLNARRIIYKQRIVIMPLVELLNHSPHAGPYDSLDGVKVGGSFEGEILVNYSSACDPLARFCTYGFTGPEPCAFSLPVRISLPEGQSLIVGLGYDKSVVRDGLALPEHDFKDGVWRLAHLKIGQKNAPRVPRTVLRRVLKDYPVSLADEAYDRIRSGNLLALADLLELADGVPGDVAAQFRAAIRWQLKAISQSFGARETAIPTFRPEAVM